MNSTPTPPITVQVTLDTSRLPEPRQGDFRARAQLNRETPEEMLARILRAALGGYDPTSPIIVSPAS